jgi:hypothetical protein
MLAVVKGEETMRQFTKRAISSWLIVAGPALLASVTVAAACASLKDPYIDRELSGKVTLTNEWLVLTPEEPLKVERDTQEVALFPDPPIKMEYDPEKGEKAVDGRDATIEAELIGTNGVTYHSRPGYEKSMTGDLYVTRYSVGFKDLPRDVTFKAVRVKSSAPYPVKKILWRCYNWSDVHS